MNIVFNGHRYDSVEHMPPDVRQQYEELMASVGGDADGDGVPDVLQKPGSVNLTIKESIVFNGKKYNSEEELPPDVRELIERMKKLKPAENDTRVEVRTTELFPPKIGLSAHWGVEADADLHKPVEERSGLSKLLISLLVVAVVVLLYLWLSGVRPAQLFGK